MMAPSSSNFSCRSSSIFGRASGLLMMLLPWSLVLVTPTTAASNKVVIGKDPQQLYEAEWTDGVCYAPISGVVVGDTLEFNYRRHNVYKMPDQKAFEECDFSQAEFLAGSDVAPFTYEIASADEDSDLYFACGIGGHCYGDQKLRVSVGSSANDGVNANTVPLSKFGIGIASNLCRLVHRGEVDLLDLNSDTQSTMTSQCSSPVASVDVTQDSRKIYSVTCLSQPITMTPGGVINRKTVVHFPFPRDRRVLLGTRIWEFVQGDLDTGLHPVNVNQLYVHHILGYVVSGAGAESIRRYDEDASFPLPYGRLTGDFDNVMTLHLIDLRHTGDDWLECAECRCDTGTATRQGDAGGITCCTNCTDLTTPTVDYRMRYNVTYTELSDLKERVRPLYKLRADIAGAMDNRVEFDVPHYTDLPEDKRLPTDPTIMMLQQEGTLNTIFDYERAGSQDDAVRIHRCTGHMHIGGLMMRLEDVETGEVVCSADATYGDDPSADLGFITSIHVTNFDSDDAPVLRSDRQFRLVTHYNATEAHTGVMGLFALFVSSAEDSATTNTVGPTEASLRVDVCTRSDCNASALPVWCADNVAESSICTRRGICTCSAFLSLPSSIVTGCGGVLKMGNYGDDIPVDYFCAETCGCGKRTNEDAAAHQVRVLSGLESRFKRDMQSLCDYNDAACQAYVSNLYSCSQGMPGMDDLDEDLRAVVLEHGGRMAMESSKLGDPFMHGVDGSIFNTEIVVKACLTDGGSDNFIDSIENSSDTNTSINLDEEEQSEEEWHESSHSSPDGVSEESSASGLLTGFQMVRIMMMPIVAIGAVLFL